MTKTAKRTTTSKDDQYKETLKPIVDEAMEAHNLAPAIKTVLQRYTECIVEDKEIDRICDGGVYMTIVGVGKDRFLVSETRLIKISDICAGINNNKRGENENT